MRIFHAMYIYEHMRCLYARINYSKNRFLRSCLIYKFVLIAVKFCLNFLLQTILPLSVISFHKWHSKLLFLSAHTLRGYSYPYIFVHIITNSLH